MSEIDWSRVRILLVDRDDGFRFGVRTLLRRRHVGDILSAVDATAARGLACRLVYDLAVVELAEDAAMDFLRWLRRSPSSPMPGLPLLVLAEGADDYRIALVRRLGVQGVLIKPASAEAVVAAMAEALMAHRMPDDPAAIETPASPASAVTPRRRGKGGVATGRSAGRIESGPVPDDAVAMNAATDPSPARFVELAAPVSTAARGEEDWGDSRKEPPPRHAPQQVDAASTPPDSVAGNPVEPSLDDLLADHAEWVASAAMRGARADLSDRDLSGVSLSGKMLANARLAGVILVGADLSDAQLHGVDLRRAEAMGANLAAANLAVARLRHARLAGVRLDGANLKGADFSGADLSGARFGEADLGGAILVGADLAGADLSAVRGLTKSQVGGARCDGATRLPPGLFSLRRENDGS